MKNLFSICITIVVLSAHSNGLAQNRHVRNGYSLPTRGTLKVMVVFAERVGGTCNPGSPTDWPAGQIPTNTSEYFDSQIDPNGPITGKLTRLYSEGSFGAFSVLGDYLDHVVQVPCSLTTSTAIDNAVRQHLTDLVDNNQISFLNGRRILNLTNGRSPIFPNTGALRSRILRMAE